MMRLVLPLLIFAFPIVEIALLISVGGSIGLWPTVGIILLTAVLGAFVLQYQGIHTWRRAQEALQAGKPPVGAAVDGMFLLLAGALLLSPGLITDAAGLLLLIPQVRSALIRWGAGYIFKNGVFRVVTIRETSRPAGAEPRSDSRPQEQPEVIEGEFERLDEKPPRRRS